MRIMCPNCDAQYEVPDDVIPVEGRDVQCSNCGNTWTQTGKTSDSSETAASFFENSPASTQFEDEPGDGPSAAPVPPRKPLDPEVEDILRKEAERETAARAAEAGGLETQPDLGLTQANDEMESRAREAKEHMARIRGEEESPAPAEADSKSEASAPAEAGSAVVPALGSRKELLPDIEEINSTLRSTSDRDLAGDDPSPDAPIRKRKKRGFRRGFLFALLIFAIALLVYIFAPQIAASVPQADPALSSYVTWVDGLRAQLDGQVQNLLKWLDATAAASGS